MRRLNQLTYEKELSAMEIEDIRTRHVQLLVATVEELVVAAEELIDAIPGLSMSFDEQLVFRDMASQLQNEHTTSGTWQKKKISQAWNSRING
jgi:hypothetical protein